MSPTGGVPPWGRREKAEVSGEGWQDEGMTHSSTWEGCSVPTVLGGGKRGIPLTTYALGRGALRAEVHEGRSRLEVGGGGRVVPRLSEALYGWERSRDTANLASSQLEGALSLFMSLAAPFLELMPLTLPWYHRFRYHHLQEAFPDVFPWFPH